MKTSVRVSFLVSQPFASQRSKTSFGKILLPTKASQHNFPVGLEDWIILTSNIWRYAVNSDTFADVLQGQDTHQPN